MGDHTWIDYDDCSKTICIDAQNFDWLIILRQAIDALINDQITEINFLDFENTRADNISLFTLNRVAEKKKTRFWWLFDREVRLNWFIDQSGKLNAIWSQDVEQLITTACLIDRLLEIDSSGHQYLAPESDELTIVLAYKEQIATRPLCNSPEL